VDTHFSSGIDSSNSPTLTFAVTPTPRPAPAVRANTRTEPDTSASSPPNVAGARTHRSNARIPRVSASSASLFFVADASPSADAEASTEVEDDSSARALASETTANTATNTAIHHLETRAQPRWVVLRRA
jgi:hypothetical protein